MQRTDEHRPLTAKHIDECRPELKSAPNVPLLNDPLEADDNDADHQAPTDMLNAMMLCDELFRTSSGVAFADFITDGHRETWPIRSKRFRTWVRRCYYRATGAAPGASVLAPALDLLEAPAQFDGPERVVHTRVAEHAGRLYLDLANERWRAVEIGPDAMAGQVLGSPPVCFRRAAGRRAPPSLASSTQTQSPRACGCS
jgi:hypothetical protein